MDAPAIELPPALRKPRLRRWEVSQYLQMVHGITIAPATLAAMVTRGGGPLFQSFNRTPLYSTVELDRWALAKLGAPRSNSSAA